MQEENDTEQRLSVCAQSKVRTEEDELRISSSNYELITLFPLPLPSTQPYFLLPDIFISLSLTKDADIKV